MATLPKLLGGALFAAAFVSMQASGMMALVLFCPGAGWAQGVPPAHPMRDMMRSMMRGFVPPPGMTAEALPAPGSEGARLTVRYCAQCHDLPSPRYRTAAEWPAVFERMNARMRMMGGGMMGGGMMGGGMMGMGRIEAPGAAEAGSLLAYLQRNGMRPASPAELQKGNPQDRAVFESACARCHALPSPTLHPAAEWPGVVARMQANVQLMDKPELPAPDREAIVRFLQVAAR